jgi:predicted enzyme related to lactoylglutathione lyase
MEMTKYDPGQFCWVELATKDAEGAKKFYGELFGWSYDEMPMGDGTSYIFANLPAGSVGAMYENKAIPSNWLVYVSVDSADDTAAKAKSLGASLKAEPFEVFDAGRMAVIHDPEGATFAIWQPRKHIGATVAGEPGTFCWNELMARDGDGERTFYTSLFGWTAKVSPEYTEWHDGEKARGGFLEMKEARFDGLPANWLTYFLVDDVDATFAKAQSLGAAPHMPGMDIPNVGRFAVLGDPQGAAFALFKPKMS